MLLSERVLDSRQNMFKISMFSSQITAHDRFLVTGLVKNFDILAKSSRIKITFVRFDSWINALFSDTKYSRVRCVCQCHETKARGVFFWVLKLDWRKAWTRGAQSENSHLLPQPREIGTSVQWQQKYTHWKEKRINFILIPKWQLLVLREARNGKLKMV